MPGGDADAARSAKVTTSSTAFGSISSAEPARNLQFGLRLAF